MSEPPASTYLWHPSHWPMWAGVAGLWLLVRLPIRPQFFAGRLIGRVLRRAVRRRASVAEQNVALCFPTWSQRERADLLKRSFDSLGIGVLEMGIVLLRSIEHLRARCVIENSEVLLEARAEGKGVILAGSHFSALELCGALLSSEIRFDIVFRPSRNPVADHLIRRARRKHYGQVIEVRSLSQAVRRLREGKIVWFAVDQDMGHSASTFVPFMGVDAASLTTVPKLAGRTGAAVVYMSQVRDAAAIHWRVKLERVRDYPSEDLDADALRMNGYVERDICQHPEQYYWVHRRFKSLRGGGRREYGG